MHKNSVRKVEKPFSIKLFVITVVVSLAITFIVLRLFFPEIWKEQFQAGLGIIIVTFLIIHFCNSFAEFFFHRYVLHKRIIPGLSYFYKQHTLHHALTRVRKRLIPGANNESRMVIENIFPILEESQHEASYFPWYSLVVFEALATPIFVITHWLFPRIPVFLGGYLAVAWSYSLYEVLHYIEHWSLDKWNPYLNHPQWGWLWSRIYAFHLRHHVDIKSNESISGFFGFPIADWIFGTFAKYQTKYKHGEEAREKDFQTKKSNYVLRWLDWLSEWKKKVVKKDKA
jgi:hemolysin III